MMTVVMIILENDNLGCTSWIMKCASIIDGPEENVVYLAKCISYFLTSHANLIRIYIYIYSFLKDVILQCL